MYLGRELLEIAVDFAGTAEREYVFRHAAPEVLKVWGQNGSHCEHRWVKAWREVPIKLAETALEG